MSNRILSLAAFTAWLASKHPRTKVGLACEADFCPIAKFLTQTSGIPYQVQGDCSDDSYTPALLKDGVQMKDEYGNLLWDEAKSTPLPQWALDFIETVDDSIDGSVSAQRALKVAESSTLGRAVRRTAGF